MKITSYFHKLIEVCSKKNKIFEETPADYQIDVESFFGRTKSLEEINKELVERGFLPQNEEYKGCSHATQEDVEKNPREFIIEECVEPCKILWGKNIFTFMCSEFCDNNAWIEILEENLSEENQQIINNLPEPFYIFKGYHSGSVIVGVKCLGQKAILLLSQFACMLKMQDVPDKESTVDLETALIQSGYSKTIPNPEYKTMKEFEESIKDIDPKEKYEKLGEYFHSSANQEFIEEVDYSKIKKSIEKILKENGFVQDKDNNKIYRNNFYYQKHLRYLEYLKTQEQVLGLK